MPLDLCHPTAPHEKLKLPEWYVSSLMMDRALDAICRRVKKFDSKHDIPYLAGYSLDGKTIYIDRHKTLIDQLGLQSGVVSAADAERWWTNLRVPHEAGTFFYAFTALIVAGTKS